MEKQTNKRADNYLYCAYSDVTSVASGKQRLGRAHQQYHSASKETEDRMSGEKKKT